MTAPPRTATTAQPRYPDRVVALARIMFDAQQIWFARRHPRVVICPWSHLERAQPEVADQWCAVAEAALAHLASSHEGFVHG